VFFSVLRSLYLREKSQKIYNKRLTGLV